jgi:hypothetical protein
MMGVRHRDFVQVLEPFPVSALQLAARALDGRDILEVRVETAASTSDLAERMRQAVLAAMPTLANRVDTGVVAELRVALYGAGQLPRNPRSSKVKAVVDERS